MEMQKWVSVILKVLLAEGTDEYGRVDVQADYQNYSLEQLLDRIEDEMNIADRRAARKEIREAIVQMHAERLVDARHIPGFRGAEDGTAQARATGEGAEFYAKQQWKIRTE